MKKQIAYLQWLRLFGAAAVVLMHTAASRWQKVPVDSARWLALTGWDSLVRWPVPVFVMITGALFLPRKTTVREALCRYAPRMALAYLIWAAVYALHSVGPGAGFRELVNAMAAGHYHLWYLPFLCGVYLMLPFLQKIAEDEHLTAQLLGLSLVIAQGIPWIVDLAAALAPGWSSALRAVENHLHFTFFFDLLSLLLLGHLLARREISLKGRRLLYGAGLLSIPLTLAGTVWLTGVTGSPSSIFFDHASPTTLCAASALFVFARYHLTVLPGWAAWLADRSFGVYLIHVLVLELLAERGWDVLAFAPVWWTPVLALAVFGISALAAAILQKIPLLGKYLA